MNWKEFIVKLLRDFRLSSSEFEQLTGVSNVIVSKIKAGKTNAPTQNTIKRIEKALNIQIDDSDAENITYAKVEEKKSIWDNDFSKLKGVETVSFADSISKGIEEMQNNIIAYTITPSDESDIFIPGDQILINNKKEVISNDIVVIKLKNGKVKIKRCVVNENTIILVDKNFNVEQISFNDIDCVFTFYGKVQTNIN